MRWNFNRKYRVEHIEFLDDTFTFDKRRAMKICKEIVNRGVGVG